MRPIFDEDSLKISLNVLEQNMRTLKSELFDVEPQAQFDHMQRLSYAVTIEDKEVRETFANLSENLLQTKARAAKATKMLDILCTQLTKIQEKL